MRMSGCGWKNTSRQVKAWDKYEGIGRSVIKAECEGSLFAKQYLSSGQRQ